VTAPPITQTLLAFGRLLRTSGVPVPISAEIDAVRALEFIELADRDSLFLTFRTILTGRVEEWPLFDQCFAAFWQSDANFHETTARAQADAHTGHDGQDGGANEPSRNDAAQAESEAAGDEAYGEPLRLRGASDEEALLQRDFSSFTGEELDEVARLTVAIAKRLARRLRRRRRRPGRRGVLDLRRSMRANLTKGEIIELRRLARRRKLRLLLLCDISGSMDLYSRLLLQFIYALQNAFHGVESFTFATHLTRISALLRGRDYKASLGLLAGAADWSGGTRIGASFHEVNKSWHHLMDRRTILIILSDGWDTGDPQLLAEEMLEFRRRVGRIIWLNPLLGVASYEPLTRGMQAALAFVDVFAAAHNLASLRDLAGRLVLPRG
jgi:uncharacterized protein with von Willebrand factor type A (vWA) domain